MSRTLLQNLHEYGFPKLGINAQNEKQHLSKVPKPPVEILTIMYFTLLLKEVG